jgi:Ethanolamine utilization protein EutJ (predicted chaperonin)
MEEKIFIGIDLGTTNCSIAFIDGETSPKNILISQINQNGSIIDSDQLPSAIYIPVEGEFENSQKLSWQAEFETRIGQYAKDRAVEVPDRVVLSAKSWLCQSAVDRKKNILPWNSEISEQKISPFFASVSFLKYLKNTLEHHFSNTQKECEIVVTVPASFDEVARNLTLEAARSAGFKDLSLLEEPLAALYSWVANQGENWREQLKVGDVILVCDIGGGTADFSLILVNEENGILNLERLSVGNHLLLGGDNMDLALAYQFKLEFEANGKILDNWQFQSLIHQSRLIKERMLIGQEEVLPLTVAGKGSSLFNNTLKIEVRREDVLSQLVEGFFPLVELDLAYVENEDTGLAEYGLPFESEPALSKHLGQFLKQSAKQIFNSTSISSDIKERARSGLILPDLVLFNGGVTTPEIIRNRLLELLKIWGATLVKELSGTNLNTAVSEGASYFSKVKYTGTGIKIKAGIPRSYYLALKTSTPAIPGFKPMTKALCIVKQGMEEGTSTELSEQVFSLLIGKEVQFQLYTSKERGEDSFGHIIDNVENVLEKNLSLKIKLESDSIIPREGQKTSIGYNIQNVSQTVPVRIFSLVNNLGLLELWMQSVDSKQSWKLEFDVRAPFDNAEKKTPVFKIQSELAQKNMSF